MIKRRQCTCECHKGSPIQHFTPCCEPDCQHKNAYFDSKAWPTGEALEICRDCGMSRAHWEQGKSPWMMVDIEKAREELQKTIDAALYKQRSE